MKGKSAPHGRNKVVSKGGKAPTNGVTKGNNLPKTIFQKLLKGWPSKDK